MATKPGTLVVRPYDPVKVRRRWISVALLWLVSLLALYFWCKATMTPNFAATQQALHRSQADALVSQAEIERLKAEVSKFQRGEQVAKEANAALQKNLDERLDEVTGLRTDLSFFQRFAGGGNAESLGVQEIHIRPTANARVYKFLIAVSQNLKRGRVVKGSLVFSVKGLVDGKPRKLDMATLLGEGGAKTLNYEFKYFQRFDGTLYLPEGFVPSSIVASMKNDDGEAAQKEVAWDLATKTQTEP
jgi:hypothetical protein